ncbi:MAG: hypothetical protein J1F65_03185 [Clostridiales bacterium]|nr:hypothetical protein [Clostridiales bacterium]
MKKSTKYNAALIAVSALFAALLVGGKEALAVLPNIEVVTLLIALCAYVWGPVVVFPAVNVFIAVDMAIWGVNTWIISYFIHWNSVAVAFWLLGKARFRHRAVEVVCVTSLAVVFSTLFGVLTSAVDTLVGFTGEGFFVDFDNVLYRFAVMYVNGVSFYVTQIVCNLVLFAVAFLPLVIVNRKAKLRMLPKDEQTTTK